MQSFERMRSRVTIEPFYKYLTEIQTDLVKGRFKSHTYTIQVILYTFYYRHVYQQPETQMLPLLAIAVCFVEKLKLGSAFKALSVKWKNINSLKFSFIFIIGKWCANLERNFSVRLYGQRKVYDWMTSYEVFSTQLYAPNYQQRGYLIGYLLPYSHLRQTLIQRSFFLGYSIN